MEIKENSVILDLEEYKEMENYINRLKETVEILKDEKLIKDLIKAEKEIGSGDYISEEDIFN